MRGISLDTYMNTEDVRKVYVNLTGSNDGWKYFYESIKTVADRSSIRGAFIFKDEEKLFELFKKNRKCSKFIEQQRIKYPQQLWAVADKWD